MLRVLALLAAARAASAGAAGGHLSLAPALPQQPEDERRVSALERRLHELEDENARLRASQDAADSLAAKSLANTDTWDAVPAEWADHIANARAHVAKHLDAPKPHGHSISDQRFWDALRPVFDEKNFPGGAKLKLQVHRKLQADRRRLQGGTFKHAANACPFGGHWNLAESFDPFGFTTKDQTPCVGPGCPAVFPMMIGDHLCGKVATGIDEGIDLICHRYFCSERVGDDKGTGMGGHAVCGAAFCCDAMCGNCQSPPVANLTLGKLKTVLVDTRFNNGTGDMPNTPKYYSLQAVQGRTYRIQAFPDTVNKIKSMLVIVADPTGDPIRRALSNNGAPKNVNHKVFVHRTLQDLEGEDRDADLGCAGDTHISVIFKALHTGEYKIGLTQLTDSPKPRSAFKTYQEYGKQWRGGRYGFPMYSDMGQSGGWGMSGSPIVGVLQLLAEDVTGSLPPLAKKEYGAMYDLKKELGIPDDIWEGQGSHPCTWGANHPGVNPACCIRDDKAGKMVSASVISVDVNMWWHVHRGSQHSGNFKGTLPESVGNLKSLRVLAIGPSHISGSMPQAITKLPLRRLYLDNTLMIGTFPEPLPKTLQGFIARSTKYLSGTLPASLSAATSIRNVMISGMQSLSGSIMSSCGHEELQILMIRESGSIAGSLPSRPHPQHPSAKLPGCFQPTALGELIYIDLPQLAGKVTEQWACKNNASYFPTTVLFALSESKLEGQLPHCLFKHMTRADTVNIDDNLFTGSIPLMNDSIIIRQVRAANNDFTSFPSAFPPALEQFLADNNPRMNAKGADLAQLLRSAPKLSDFSFMVDNTLRIAWTEILQQGAIPMLVWSQVKPTIPLDCRAGEPCGFELRIVLGIQYRPLRSIGVDFSVRMSPVVDRFDDHTSSLSSSLFNSTNPQNTTGRRRTQGAITIPIETVEAQVLSNGSKPIVAQVLKKAWVRSELELHLDTLNMTLPMTDTDDGSVHARFSTAWFPASGRYQFRMFGRNSKCKGRDTPPPGSGLTPNPMNPTPCMEHLIELADKSLWHINIHPIDCISSFAAPDAAGTTCRCRPGHGAPAGQQSCQLGDRECECPQCLNGFFSADGISCLECPEGTVSNSDKTVCICEPGRYNASMGTITCIDQNYRPDEFHHNPLYAVARAQFEGGMECLECPLCVDCLRGPTLKVQPGFHLSPSVHAQIADMRKPFNKTFMRCRPETAHTDGLGNIDGRGYDAQGEGDLPAVQCVGGPLQNDGLACAIGHTGTLCGECADGYGRKNVNQCVQCEDTWDPLEILKLSVTVASITFLVGLTMIGLSFAIGDVYDTVEIQQTHTHTQQKFTNPIQNDEADDDEAPRSPRQQTLLADTTRPASQDLAGDAIDVVFEELDEDGSGQLDQEEVAQLAERMGKKLTAQQLTEAMAAMDVDGSGSVDRLELRRWLATLGTRQATRVVTSHAIIRTSKRLLSSGASMSVQPAKLFLSYWQIAAHMGAVLHFQFPPLISNLFAIFKPLVANIHGVVALECAGLRDFYSTWVFEIFVIPIFLAGVVLAYYAYRLKIEGRAVADSKFRNEAFFVLFIIYPFITNKLFGVLNCRTVGPHEEVLVTDYTIDCNSDKHATLEIVSVIMICGFSVSVPLVMAITVAKNRAEKNKRFSTPAWQYIARRAMAQLGHDNLDEVRSAIIDITLGIRYGSLISAFKPGFFYWECLDMTRKLILVGMLTSVERGSTLQVCTGLCFSFVFFAAHMKTMPYRHVEDNILKACTEIHLFVILMLVLTLKSDLHGEAFSVHEYDAIATVLFLLLVPLTAILCIWHKWRTVVRDDIESAKDITHTAKLQKAFSRQRLGRDKDEDRALLAAYFAKMEDEVNSHFHVFISYRVASEAQFAKALFDALSTMTLAETGQKLRVYLDQVRLEDGQRWDQGFMSGLSASWIMVPIVSTKCLAPMAALNTNSSAGVDNVLLEWTAGLELFARDEVRAIIPIIACDDSGEEFSWSLPKELSELPHDPTIAATKMHLLKLPSSRDLASESNLLDGVAETVSEVMQGGAVAGEGKVSVAGVVAAILRFQGVLLADRTDMDKCTSRIFQKVTDILGAGTEAESTPKGDKKQSSEFAAQ